MASDFENIKNIIGEIRQNYSTLTDAHDHIDKLLLEVIKIERRHLYGLDTTSSIKRRSEIEAFLDKSFDGYREAEHET